MAFDGNGSRLQARVVIEQYRERECLVYSALVWEVGWNQQCVGLVDSRRVAVSGFTFSSLIGWGHASVYS